MTADYTNQVATGLLLMSFVSVLAVGILLAVLVLLYVRHRHHARAGGAASDPEDPSPFASKYRPSIFDPACRWVVIRSRSLSSVQIALGLHNPVRCPPGEGLSKLTSHSLFVSPPLHGWILVIGQGLPEPSDDVDACFHFVRKLSRAFGHVQFFNVNRALNHHAWVRADHGHIRRAYVWAGETLWNQGELTAAERDLKVQCYGYGEGPSPLDQGNNPVSSADKLMFLAARWGLDPARLDEHLIHAEFAVVGELTHSKPH
jgi:hypothetical protein